MRRQSYRSYRSSGAYLSLSEKHTDLLAEIPIEEFLIAKKNGQVIWAKTVKVQCLGGKFHNITMQLPGRIILHGHPSMSAEKTMMGLGGEKPPCLILREHLVKENVDVLANRPTFKAFAIMRHKIHEGRNKIRAMHPEDALQSPETVNRKHFLSKLRGRLDARIEKELFELRSRVNKEFKGDPDQYPFNRQLDGREPWQQRLVVLQACKTKKGTQHTHEQAD